MVGHLARVGVPVEEDVGGRARPISPLALVDHFDGLLPIRRPATRVFRMACFIFFTAVFDSTAEMSCVTLFLLHILE